MTNKYMTNITQKFAPICTLLVLALWGNGQAFGYCYFTSTYTTLPMRLTLPANLVIQRDTPLGVAVWTSGPSTSSGGGTVINCTTGTAFIEATQYVTAPTLVSGYTDVYQSNIPGIGFRVRNQGTYSLWDSIPKSISYTPPATDSNWTYTENKYIFFKMELIYIGGTASGKLSFASPLASLTTGSVTAGQLYIDGSSTVSKVACSLSSTSINVPLGDVLISKFTGVGVSTADKSFNLGLTCDKEAKINVSLAGTQNTDTTEASVLALTSAGQTGTATGVGVQLLYGGTPLKINNNLALKTSTAGGKETLPFTARYYQTKATVGIGQANSSATLNITYQ
ncbi:fimbrial protein [Serratia quinivorans]|uniref:fimbrial protein n=1 Tax=Serratia quinivorans TaxID=137545 RepID=UPI0021BDB6EF|nr:fimbrial protein [Serratia quinivorans]